MNIKSGAVLFPGCIITAGVTIGENSLIGAGSVVSEDVPDYCVAVGNPARVVKRLIIRVSIVCIMTFYGDVN